MSYFESNLNAIKMNREYLSKQLDELQEKSYLSILDNVESIEAKDGNMALRVTYQNVQYRLNSSYNPAQEALRWVQQYDFSKLGIVISMFGLGNGLLARELIRRKKKEDILLIYEPSIEIFNYVIEYYDLTDIFESENVSVTVKGVNDNEFDNLLMSSVDWLNVRSQIICNHTGYDTSFPDAFREVIKRIHDNNDRAVTNKNTESHLGRQFIYNTLSNMKYLSNSNIITDYNDRIPNDIPAIIVAAGPSLDKNIDDLKLAKDKALIIATDTSVKYLLAHNIIPDFTVTIDPCKYPGHYSDERCMDIPMFCKVESNPAILSQHTARKIFFNLEGYIKDIYQHIGKDTGGINTGGSVATGAFAICVELNIKHIIFIGLDLAYAGNVTHAGGAVVDVTGCGNFQQTVEDIYGNPIQTRHDWYEYLKWFADAVAFYSEGEVIDATEGGAKIKGTTIMTLKEAIDKYCISSFDSSNLICNVEPTFTTEGKKMLFHELQKSVTDLDTITTYVENGTKLCEKLMEEYSKVVQESYTSISMVKELNKLSGIIESYPVYLLIDTFLSDVMLSEMAEILQYTTDNQEDKINTYRKTKVIYESILDAIKQIKPQLEEALEHVIVE